MYRWLAAIGLILLLGMSLRTQLTPATQPTSAPVEQEIRAQRFVLTNEDDREVASLQHEPDGTIGLRRDQGDYPVELHVAANENTVLLHVGKLPPPRADGHLATELAALVDGLFERKVEAATALAREGNEKGMMQLFQIFRTTDGARSELAEDAFAEVYRALGEEGFTTAVKHEIRERLSFVLYAIVREVPEDEFARLCAEFGFAPSEFVRD